MDAKLLLVKGRRAMHLHEPAAYEEAVACLWEAIDEAPGFSPAYAALSEAYSYWGFRLEISGHEAQSYYDLAYHQAQEALSQAPELAEAHRAAAMALRRGSRADPRLRFSEARKAVELGLDGAENWYELWRAMGYRVEDGAIRRTLELDPALFPAVHDLAVALYQAGRLDEAETRFREALRLNPDNALARYNLAMSLEGQGRIEDARAELRRAAERTPDETLIIIGKRYLEDGNGWKN